MFLNISSGPRDALPRIVILVSAVGFVSTSQVYIFMVLFPSRSPLCHTDSHRFLFIKLLLQGKSLILYITLPFTIAYVWCHASPTTNRTTPSKQRSWLRSRSISGLKQPRCAHTGRRNTQENIIFVIGDAFVQHCKFDHSTETIEGQKTRHYQFKPAVAYLVDS